MRGILELVGRNISLLTFVSPIALLALVLTLFSVLLHDGPYTADLALKQLIAGVFGLASCFALTLTANEAISIASHRERGLEVNFRDDEPVAIAFLLEVFPRKTNQDFRLVGFFGLILSAFYVLFGTIGLIGAIGSGIVNNYLAILLIIGVIIICLAGLFIIIRVIVNSGGPAFFNILAVFLIVLGSVGFYIYFEAGMALGTGRLYFQAAQFSPGRPVDPQLLDVYLFVASQIFNLKIWANFILPFIFTPIFFHALSSRIFGLSTISTGMLVIMFLYAGLGLFIIGHFFNLPHLWATNSTYTLTQLQFLIFIAIMMVVNAWMHRSALSR